ncbi:TPA: zinc-binding dehydrogenase [Neisseria subflava]
MANYKPTKTQNYDKILELVGLATLCDSFTHINEHGIICNTGQLGNIWYVIWQFNVKILIERVFTLEQVPEAHRFLQSADGFGKVVVVNE